MIKAPPTPKGFRDIMPELAQKRRNAINKIVSVLEEFSFVPIETPTVEFADTLKGKYGEEERLIYEFADRGGRKLALRYDLTVPLARFVASNLNLIAKGPFRRYQIGQVFRGENPQRGRWREFTQFDFDSIGRENTPEDPEEDAIIITAAIKSIRAIGLSEAVMAINHRARFSNVPIEVIRAFDKLHKINIDGVKQEIIKNGYAEEDFEKFKYLFTTGKEKVILNKLFAALRQRNLTEGKDFIFDPSLARGLDYYTGAIFELRPSPDVKDLSIGGGGRYDNLVGMFARSAGSGQAKKDIPAVGFSFGLDRLMELLPNEL